MSTAMTRMDQSTKTLYVAFELGEKEWKLAMSPGLEVRPRLRSLRARGTTQLAGDPREGATAVRGGAGRELL